jgi:CheY-like chemotaxis protein
MKILVVDDEHDIQALFQQRFRKETKNGEMQFAFAFSGEEALDYVHQHDHEVILILSDINMPGMSGLVLLEKIKEEFASPPPIVMMVTAYGDSENYDKAMQLGADDFLTKPVDFTLLKEKLKKLIHV